MKSHPWKILATLSAVAAITAGAYWDGYRRGAAAAQQESGAKTAAAQLRASSNGAAFSSDATSLSRMTLDGLLHGALKPDASLLASWALGLSPQQRLDAMNSLQNLPAGEPRDDILKAIVTAMAQTDPKGFLASAGNVTNARLREGGITAALQKLGAGDPQDALDWIKQNAADASNSDLARQYEAALNGYATTDPAGALNAASALPEDSRNDRQIKSKAMEGIAEGMASEGEFTDAVALFDQMPANTFQNDGLGRVADLWAVVAPQDAANWISTVADPSLQNDLGQNLADTWGNSDPAAAAKWAAQIDQLAAAAGASSDSGDALLAHVMDDWSRADLNAAGQFINQMPASPVKDNAIASFASRAAQDDPSAAMDWVATISDDQARQQAAQQVAKQWVKQDPASLAQFLNTTDLLTNQQKQTLANSLNKTKGGAGQNNQN
jgi:hypothetical protein